MRNLYILLWILCGTSVLAQTDTLRAIPADTVQIKQGIQNNHPPQLINKEPEILWLNNFRQTLSYQFPTKGFYKDDEGHEIAFRLLTKDYAGIRLSPEGLLTCQLSLAEYQKLPITIAYEIFETNSAENLATKGQLLLKKARADLPPTIIITPKTLRYSIEETDSVAIKIIVTDPNDDLNSFEVYSSVQYGRFNPINFLNKTNENTYWFKWQPTYDFVQIRNEQDERKRTFQLIFEAKDETDSTTKIAIDMEVFDKTDWSVEDQIRQQDFKKVVWSATETLIRLEKTFAAMDKDIKKMFRNKKLKQSLGNSLSIISQNDFLKGKIIGNDEEKQQWLKTANDMQQERTSISIEQEYPSEFSKIQRFGNIVFHLKNIYVDTEQFIGKYAKIENRRNEAFIADQQAIQKNISSILKDASLDLIDLNIPITQDVVNSYFHP